MSIGIAALALRILQILAFLLAITLVSDLCQDAGLFDAAVDGCAQLARGKVWLLVLLLAVVGVAATWTLSLDATAVLLTPVALRAAKRLQLPALPLAFLCIWIANMASFLLPAANLTNLLALTQMHVGAVIFVSHTWKSQLVLLMVLAIWFMARFGKQLRGTYCTPDPIYYHPRLVKAAALSAGGLVILILIGMPAWAAAWLTAVALIGAHLVWGSAETVRPGRLIKLMPWDMTLFVTGLFVLVTVVSMSWPPGGLDTSTVFGKLQMAGLAAVLANVINNLPAYLALEAMPTSSDGLYALLLGVNVGPSVLLWGSLANLLWRQRCKAAGINISVLQFALEGLGLTGVGLIAATLVL